MILRIFPLLKAVVVFGTDDDLILKNVAWLSNAMAFPMRVLPVPGGPKRSRPLGSCRRPLNRPGGVVGVAGFVDASASHSVVTRLDLTPDLDSGAATQSSL